MKNRKHAGHRRRLTARETRPDEVSHVSSTARPKEGRRRDVPTITLRGDWLKALGFPIGAPIHVFAEAHGRMAICRMGLHKPRWLRIVAPGSNKPAR
jgi:hypothetical protein